MASNSKEYMREYMRKYYATPEGKRKMIELAIKNHKKKMMNPMERKKYNEYRRKKYHENKEKKL